MFVNTCAATRYDVMFKIQINNRVMNMYYYYYNILLRLLQSLCARAYII